MKLDVSIITNSSSLPQVQEIIPRSIDTKFTNNADEIGLNGRRAQLGKLSRPGTAPGLGLQRPASSAALLTARRKDRAQAVLERKKGQMMSKLRNESLCKF